MKKNGITLLIGVFILSIGTNSCTKTKENVLIPIMKTKSTGYNPTPQIVDFYNQMKVLKENPNTNATSFSVNDAVFLMEGAYNYYAVKQEYKGIYQPTNFEVTAPLNAEGNVSAQDIANAFWQIKNKLMETYNSIDFSDKKLTSLDIEAHPAGSNIVFSISASILSALLPYSITKTFTEGADHAWFVPTGNAPNYSNGQCDIDMANKTAYNIDNTLPGAAAVLRTYGVYNYMLTFAQPCGYYTNISSSSSFVNTPPSPNGQISDYYANSIPGYDNSTIWNTYIFTNVASIPFQFADPNIVFKNYLTTPMMNYYLQFIPNIISTHVPAGKSFYDFNITWVTCLCSPSAPYSANNPSWPYPALRYDYRYYVQYGDYVVGCYPNPSLPSM